MTSCSTVDVARPAGNWSPVFASADNSVISEPRHRREVPQRRSFAGLPSRLKESAREIIHQPVPAALRLVAREVNIAVGTRTSTEQLRRLTNAGGLEVHLGCGPDLRAGWLNVDVGCPSHVPRGTLFIRHDLRRGLPLRDDSCALIYSSHLLEHLDYRKGVNLLRDCHRSLGPQGRFRIALPNLRSAFDAYLRNDEHYFDLISVQEVAHVAPATRSIVDWINYSVYQWGEHLTIYDEEKMVRLLEHLGFRSVRPVGHDASIDSTDPLRVKYSFYVEATK